MNSSASLTRLTVRTSLIVILLLGIAQVSAQAADSSAAAPPPPPAAKSQEETLNPAFKDQKEKLSYAVGMNLANAIQKQSVEVDPDLVIQGFQDAFSGSETLMTEQEVGAILIEKKNELANRRLTLGAKKSEERKKLAERNKKEGEAFLAENKAKEGVVTLPSGLQYSILKAGDGTKPTLDDTVVLNYRGTLIDGTEIDSSDQRGGPVSMRVTRKRGIPIAGWREAIQLMPAGSRWQLFIPSHLAYGDRTRGKVGPNSTLIYDVELVSVNSINDIIGTAAQAEDADANASQDGKPD